MEDGAAMLQILERIGMSVCFRYQKYRREFALDRVHVAVDETPIGNYVEFEGTEDGIRALARKMGIAEIAVSAPQLLFSVPGALPKNGGSSRLHGLLRFEIQDSIRFNPESRI